MAHNPIFSLLERISIEQIDDLIFEQELKNKGYSFFYTLDNHDIRKFCFPGELDGQGFERDESGEINYELETDIITAYDEFFNNIASKNPLYFLDEYLPELEGLRDQIVEGMYKKNLFDYSRTFNNYLENSLSDDDLQEDFTLFISIATGKLKNGAERFNYILNNPHFIADDNTLAYSVHAEIFKDVFHESYQGSLSYIDEIHDAFRKIGNKNPSKRIDSEAIARTISINNDLLSKYSNEKFAFLFLSTTKSTSDVFEKISKILPLVEGKNFNFHRTVEQLFLNRLIQDLPHDDKIERLKNAKRLVLYRRENLKLDKEKNSIFDGISFSQLEIAINNFQDLREEYINLHFSRKAQFIKIEKLYNDLFVEKGRTSYGALKSLYNKLKIHADVFSDKDTNLEEIARLESAFKIGQIFIIVFKKAVHKLMHGQSLTVSRGKDCITGTGQHLPIVFAFNKVPFGQHLDDISEVYLNQFAFYYSPTDIHQNIIDKLRTLTNSIYEKDFNAKALEEKFVFCLYLLILPEAKLFQKKRNNNDYVEEFLEDLYLREVDRSNSSYLHADFLYALTWVLRRNTKYKEALLYAEKGLELFPNDARFYHARFLINYCIMDSRYAFSTLNENKKHLLDIKKAQDLYPNLLEKKDKIIRNNIDATLLNSQIFAEVSIIQIDQIPKIEKSEKLLKIREHEFKKLKDLMGDSYKNYPEFAHTEAFLEKNESENETDIGLKISKLGYAIRTLTIGINTAEKLSGFKTNAFTILLTELINMKNDVEKRYNSN